jgi:hypothetical protein
MFIRPLVLDAGLTAREAAERLAVHAAKTHTVIRRVAGQDVFFHMIEVGDVQQTLTAAPTDSPLETVLLLEGKPGTRLRQMNQALDVGALPSRSRGD